ncbi:MAG: hypothetical protein RL417_1388 [Pseudomonadota bacterium]|jgi:pyruvate dehydrogenase E2 component (dihydrolipoamide acetyltransferase)
MAVEIKMPQLSDTMSAGKILAWKKKEGERVERGDILAEVETDKANLEIECFHPGTLLKVVAPTGTNAKVGEVIAIIGQAGEQVSAPTGAAQTQPAAQAGPVAPAPAAPTPALAAPPRPVSPTAPPQGAFVSPDRIKASPLARKVAQQRNIDLATIQGSGPNGRIVRDDVERAGSVALAAQPEALRPQLHAVTPPARATTESGGQRRPFSKMRETIARRMQESVVEAPHFYTTTSISMTQALRLREVLKERPEFKGISVNHLVVKAAGYALAKEPRVNCAVKDNEVYIPNQINIGIITAIEDGLLIPVVREVDTLALKDLVFEARAAVERAKAGRPSSTDLTGGTFSISNMGMFDVDSFTAIINPGQGAILAVGSVREEPIVRDGQVVIDQRMKVTLSVDHRIIDGVMAGTFLKHFKEALEIPALLM